MSKDPDEIRHEIDQTREELGETLEAIGARVAPAHVAQRVKDDVDERLDDLGDRVSPKRILARRTESLRAGLRSIAEEAEGDDAGAPAAAADRLRRAYGAAAEQVSAAPPQAQVVAAFGAGLVLTALLPSFARGRSALLVVGTAVAGFALARLGRQGAAAAPVDPSAGTECPGAGVPGGL